MADRNKDRANLGEQTDRQDRANLGEQSRRASSSDDTLSRSGIDRSKEDLGKVDRDVDDVTRRKGSERTSERDTRDTSRVERGGGTGTGTGSDTGKGTGTGTSRSSEREDIQKGRSSSGSKGFTMPEEERKASKPRQDESSPVRERDRSDIDRSKM